MCTGRTCPSPWEHIHDILDRCISYVHRESHPPHSSRPFQDALARTNAPQSELRCQQPVHRPGRYPGEYPPIRPRLTDIPARKPSGPHPPRIENADTLSRIEDQRSFPLHRLDDLFRHALSGVWRCLEISGYRSFLGRPDIIPGVGVQRSGIGNQRWCPLWV